MYLRRKDCFHYVERACVNVLGQVEKTKDEVWLVRFPVLRLISS